MNTSLGLKKSLDQDQTALKDVKSTLVISIKFFLLIDLFLQWILVFLLYSNDFNFSLRLCLF